MSNTKRNHQLDIGRYSHDIYCKCDEESVQWVLLKTTERCIVNNVKLYNQ